MYPRFGGGARLHVYDALASTQDAAREYATSHGAAVVRHAFYTENQTAGRGRPGKTWHAPPGANVNLTVIVPPVAPADRWRITIAVAVAVADTVAGFVPGDAARVRFPNDILLGGKKVAGILVEIADGLPLVGIGINGRRGAGAMPPDVAVRCTTIETHTGAPVDLCAVRDTVLTYLAVVWETWFHDNDFAAILSRWHTLHDANTRRTFTLRGEPVSCRVLGVTEAGDVTIELPSGVRETLPVAHVLL